MTIDSKKSELEWLAFCYVAGELSESDCTAFETRLEIDPSAREAVADAVAFSVGIRFSDAEALPSQLTGSTSSLNRLSRQKSILPAGLAVCLALALLAVWSQRYASDQSRRNSIIDAVTKNLQTADGIALAWSDIQQLAEVCADDDANRKTESVSDDPWPHVDSEPEPTLPEWLEIAAGLGGGGN